MSTLKPDICIIGGGITGLWLINRLQSLGYQCVLVEQTRLGAGQTLSAQGIIHGGIKYSLPGGPRQLQKMPQLWRQCLAGQGPVDLGRTRITAARVVLFSDQSLVGRMSNFFSTKLIAGELQKISPQDWPDAFSGGQYHSELFQGDDFVIDVSSLLHNLANDVTPCFVYDSVRKVSPDKRKITLGNGQLIDARLNIFAAGEGNGNLGLTRTKLRPLHQVVLTAPDLPEIYAHAIGPTGPRLTITTHKHENEQNSWYLGGELAETGVDRNVADQVEFARQELRSLVPWVDTTKGLFRTFRVNRSEPMTTRAQNNHTFECYGPHIVCWPVKMTLVPALADEIERAVKQMLGEPCAAALSPLTVERPIFATPPWSLL